MTLPDAFFSVVRQSLFALFHRLGMSLFMAADKSLAPFTQGDGVALLLFIPVYACRTMGHDGFRNLENLLCGTLCSYAVIFASVITSIVILLSFKSILHVGKTECSNLSDAHGGSFAGLYGMRSWLSLPLTYLVALIVAVIMGWDSLCWQTNTLFLQTNM